LSKNELHVLIKKSVMQSLTTIPDLGTVMLANLIVVITDELIYYTSNTNIKSGQTKD